MVLAVNFNAVMKLTQCFDTVGWASGRSAGLYEIPLHQSQNHSLDLRSPQKTGWLNKSRGENY